VSPAAVLRREADQLMERGDFPKAAAKYQDAVAIEPNDMSLRFALGSAYSNLGKRAETVEQFRWVLKQGDPRAEYYRSAKDWFARAGLLAEGSSNGARAAPDTATEEKPQDRTKGRIVGQLDWPGIASREQLVMMRVTLTGDDDGTKAVKLSSPFGLGGHYEFSGLIPGKYRLVAASESGGPVTELWNQPVTVEAGQTTQLPLSASNSKVSPEVFPGRSSRD
jgi:tetratricopeptide (TPR) repeat protein